MGAGLGVLTWELSTRARQVISYESDHRLAEYLRRDLPDNVDLREEDALGAEWPPFDKMVANVPYSISSPLLFKLLETDYAVAVLLLQREFADRLVARPRTKAYGRMTVAAARLADVELLEVVPPTAFHPRPKVDSAIVRIIPQRSFPVLDEGTFETLLRVVFSQRRKMLHNSLGAARMELAPHVDKDTWKAEIRDLEFANARPEELTPEELGLLADAIYEFRS
ncbi:MAG: ribosomal RNA small subunit methyltransferase A [Thermoplasmata archaeon]|nr:ribosomal RNA small subunit methyltransferase A [Thermoplasmata archaeon]NIS14023.1 ribosomal RNA small subunit methyltransferase A [Thermoplasmata archaeon]NIS21855.1 ribosomal RNA small subunit methyltransferase A [Thermoplasmata archaeon]NIT79460.1 ribosomal RNA small subunit methyltransferase A [Thermoplasmata archaeon]NIU50890.1 ribosomal RNA small subunit methyltransferase A [Thermoplasmata archaeon]